MIRYFIIFSMAIVFSCCQDKMRTVVQDVQLEEVVSEDHREPPPPSFSCADALTLQEWFFKLCDSVKPTKNAVHYQLQLFGTDKCYGIYLAPLDTNGAKELSNLNQDVEISGRYYPIDRGEYIHLNQLEVEEKMKSQLMEFSKTKHFSNSSLARATAVNIRFRTGDSLQLK